MASQISMNQQERLNQQQGQQQDQTGSNGNGEPDPGVGDQPAGLACERCGYRDCKVVDSRVNKDGTHVRRRRECVSTRCHHRFTTYEVYIRDIDRMEYDVEKLMAMIHDLIEQSKSLLQKMENIRIKRGPSKQRTAIHTVTPNALR